MRIHVRNTRPVRLIVPSLHLELDPGATARIADPGALPDGLEHVDAAPPPRKQKSRTVPAPEAAPADSQEQ